MLKSFDAKRTILLFGVVILAIALLVGCGNNNSSAPTTNQPQQPSGGGNEAPEEQKVDFPKKDIEFIVGFNPGGGYDTWARVLAPFIEKHLPGNHSVIVKNVPGAGGITGAQQVYRANPDGHMLNMFNVGGMVGSQLAGDTPFDIRDFTWLAQVSEDPQMSLVSPVTGITSFEDMANADRPIILALEGVAVNSTMASLLIFTELGITSWSELHHDGKSESILSLMRGDADYNMGSVDSVAQYTNDVTPIAYFDHEPHPDFPDVPIAKELGLEHLVEVVKTRRMIGTTPNTPPEIVAILDEAIKNAMEDPDFHEELKKLDYSIQYLGASDAQAMIEETINAYSQYEQVIKDFVDNQ